MKFKITYTSGLVEEVEQSDVDSIEGFINTKFGTDLATVTENGTTVELLDAGGEPAAVIEPEAPAEETPAA